MAVLVVCAALWAAPRAVSADEATKAAEPPAASAPEAAKEAPAAEPADAKSEPGKEAAPAKKKWISGSFDAGLNAVWVEGGSDIDLIQYLRLKVDPPQCPNLHLRGALWTQEDLDSDEPRNSVLRDVNDAFESDFRARLLYLYADIDNLWGDSTLRIGRQRILEGAAYNRIDGVYFKQRYPRWDWYVFGGARASLYDDTHDDLVTGGGASVRATDTTRLALDAYYGEDRRSAGNVVQRDISDTAIALSVWQAVTANLTLFGRYTWHEGRGDEILLNATGLFPSWDLTYELAYRHQLNSFGNRVNDLTGFYRILGSYHGHDNYFAAVHKPLTKQLTLSLEAEIHDANGHDWLTANENYQRYAVIVDAVDLGIKGLDAKLGLERWNVQDAEGAWTLMGEVAKRWKSVRVALGADYQRYAERVIRYDATPRRIDQLRTSLIPGQYQGYSNYVVLNQNYIAELHEDVRSIYLKTKWAVTKDQDLTAGITYETDDGPQSPYWRLKAEYTIRF